MTDEQIVKALEYCVVRNRECLSCPYSEKTYCVDTDALNLIKRQKAEIERLQKILDKRCDVCPAATTAIKEFWVKLKTNHARKMHGSDFCGAFWDRAVLVEEGDNLIKEMVGEKDV